MALRKTGARQIHNTNIDRPCQILGGFVMVKRKKHLTFGEYREYLILKEAAENGDGKAKKQLADFDQFREDIDEFQSTMEGLKEKFDIGLLSLTKTKEGYSWQPSFAYSRPIEQIQREEIIEELRKLNEREAERINLQPSTATSEPEKQSWEENVVVHWHREMIMMWQNGYTAPEIAQKFNKKPRTVTNRISDYRAKLGEGIVPRRRS